jgi:hypothetical protein
MSKTALDLIAAEWRAYQPAQALNSQAKPPTARLLRQSFEPRKPRKLTKNAKAPGQAERFPGQLSRLSRSKFYPPPTINEVATNKRIATSSASHSFIRLIFVDKGAAL